MSAPILDQAPAHQPMPTPPPRRRRALTLLTAGTLVLLATGIGVGVAIANRPAPTAPAPSAAAEEPGTATPDTQPGRVQQRQPTQGQQPTAPAGGGTATGKPPVLADGKHDAFIRKLDTRGGSVVVDVVQVFKDKAAVDAAVQDGRSRDAAQYLSVYVRNENPRLRTLPLASGFQVDLHGACEESSLSRQQLLDTLAGNAKLDGTYYYTLTVKDGTVQRIDERLAISAC
jgi:hypothetical protein